MHLLRVPFLLTGLVALACLVAAAQAKDEPVRLEISPGQVKLRLGESKQFAAKLKGKDGAIRWQVEGTNAGRITTNGVYHTPSEATTPATVRVIATADGEPTARGEALVFLEPVDIEVKPETVSLQTSKTFQFTARVGGTADQRVRWTVDGGAGRITDAGIFNAPGSFATPGTITVRATSMADPSKSTTATVKIEAVSIKIDPDEATLRHGESKRFTAKVSGTPNPNIIYQVVGDGMGEVSSQGLYTTAASMATPAEVTVVAMAEADPTKRAMAKVKVPPVQIVIGDEIRDRPRNPRATPLARIGRGVYRAMTPGVVRLFMPFNPIDLIVPGPKFQGKSGKRYVPLGGGTALEATVRGSTNDRIRWTIEGNPVGEITEEGFYQSPRQLATPQMVQIRGTALADPTKSVVFTLTIPDVVVHVPEKKENKCLLYGLVQLQAKVENTEDARMKWSVEGGDGFGTVTDAGLYHAPVGIATPTTVHVRASAVADPTKFVLIPVQIPAASLDLSPGSAEVKPGQSVRFKAKAKGCAGENAPDVIWKLTPEIGTISADGVYQAPAEGGAQVVQISAALRADPTKTATARLKIRDK